jgi:hypothetical protein
MEYDVSRQQLPQAIADPDGISVQRHSSVVAHDPQVPELDAGEIVAGNIGHGDRSSGNSGSDQRVDCPGPGPDMKRAQCSEQEQDSARDQE